MKVDKRQILIDHCKAQGEIKTSEANGLLSKYYYCNHAHYVSEILSRLVKSGIFERVKKGLYKIKTSPVQCDIELDPNQLNLF